MKSKRLTKLAQHIYLAYSNYTRNSMFESAASCSFGFVFSFIPVIMLALGFLSGTLSKYPSVLEYILSINDDLDFVFDLRPIIIQFTNRKAFTWVDAVLMIWVIWVARRFFLSIARGISRIFHSETPQKGYVIQLMTFIGEFALILGLIAIVIASFLLNQFFKLPTFTSLAEMFPILFGNFFSRLSAILFYAVIFLFTIIVYRFESRTAPRLRWCVFFAALSTGCFWVVSFFINKFMNIANYNLIYGAISSVIILMLKVYLFFMLFLFFGQYLYIYQHFDTLLFGELYLLPPANSKKLGDIIKRKLFIDPSVLQTEENTLLVKKGEIIYRKGDSPMFAYFIKSGRVTEEFDDRNLVFDAGIFFGEKSCVMKRNRSGTTSATTDCEIIKIEAEEFRTLLMKNPRASAYAMGKL